MCKLYIAIVIVCVCVCVCACVLGMPSGQVHVHMIHSWNSITVTVVSHTYHFRLYDFSFCYVTEVHCNAQEFMSAFNASYMMPVVFCVVTVCIQSADDDPF